MRERVKYIKRETGELLAEKIAGESALRFCYENPLGKILLELIVKWPWLSALYGMYQDSEASKSKINQFIKDKCDHFGIRYVDMRPYTDSAKPLHQTVNDPEGFIDKMTR